MLHIHLLDKSFKAAPESVSDVDFLDPAMAADFAFALYTSNHGLDSRLGGFVLKDEGGAVVHEWRRGAKLRGAAATGQVASEPPPPTRAPTGFAEPVAAIAPKPDPTPAAASRRSRKSRRALVRPWSPVVYRPLVAGLGLVAILGSVGADLSYHPVPRREAQAAAPPTPSLDAEGRSVYVARLSSGLPDEYAPVVARKARPVSLKHRGSRRARSSTHSRWATR